MYIVWNYCLPIADFETTGVKTSLLPSKMMNFMKVRTFYKKKKLPLLEKTQFCILIKNSNLKYKLL